MTLRSPHEAAASVPRRVHGRRPATLLSAVLLVTAIVAVPAGAAVSTISPAWTAPAGIPAAMTNAGSPALASYDGLLYAAWQGASSPYHIWYSAYDSSTDTWSPEAEVPSALTNYRTGPALAVYDGDLYVAWQGQSGPIHIWYSAFNGSTWTPQTEVPSALAHISSTPGLAAYDGDLYLSWTGQSSPYAAWYSAFNGSSWSAQATIPSSSSDNYQATDTALASYDGDLYASWETGTDNILQYSAFNGSSWSGPSDVSGGADSNAGPALAVKGKKLFESWIDYSTLAVDTASFNGVSWGAVKSIPGSSIIVETGPSLATYSGSLFDAWDPNSSPSAIEYSIGS
jgi:hypothetical protein